MIELYRGMMTATMRWILLLLLLALGACAPVPGEKDQDGDGAPDAFDCDDTRADVRPGGVERCDEGQSDEDCDGLYDADDPDVADRAVLHPDTDGDGYGAATTESTCPGAGWTTDGDDCDDGDPGVHPGAAEVCDVGLVDEDCDGQVNGADPDATAPLTWYADVDADGWGGDLSSVSCDAPPGTRPVTGDCDDADATRFPGAAEACNLLDDDCDGVTDEAVTSPVWVDADLDGYGDPSQPVDGCDVPGYATNGEDCDDDAEATNPGALEICADGVDQDCDGTPSACDLAGERAPADADAVFPGGLSEERLGTSLAGVGDIDGDGVEDWVAGAPAGSLDAPRSGAAYLIGGGARGELNAGSATARIRGDGTGYAVGAAVLGVGDLNGDGFDDLAVTATGAPWRAAVGGAVGIFLGPLAGDVDYDDADGLFHGTEAFGGLGTTLVDGQDVTGDGAADLLVAAPAADVGGTDRGIVYAVNTEVWADASVDDATGRVEGARDDQQLGRALAGLGDVDGDGVGDLAIGDATADADAGAVYLIAGPLQGAVSVDDADTTVRGDDPEGLAGATVVAAGDLDGDGRADLAFGAPTTDGAEFEAGAVFLFLDPFGATSTAEADATVTGAASFEDAGASLAAVGDVDGDGRPDLAVTAARWPDGRDVGRVYLVSGARGGTTTVDDHLLAIDGISGTAGFGGTLAAAGDPDGDGHVDLLTANPQSDLNVPGGGAVWLFLDQGT